MVGGDSLTEKKKKKKVKLDQPARHPAGSGGEEPEGKCRSGRRPLQVGGGETQPRVVQGSSYRSPQNTGLRGVRRGECAPQISNQPPPQAERPPNTER